MAYGVLETPDSDIIQWEGSEVKAAGLPEEL